MITMASEWCGGCLCLLDGIFFAFPFFGVVVSSGDVGREMWLGFSDWAACKQTGLGYGSRMLAAATTAGR